MHETFNMENRARRMPALRRCRVPCHWHCVAASCLRAVRVAVSCLRAVPCRVPGKDIKYRRGPYPRFRTTRAATNICVRKFARKALLSLTDTGSCSTRCVSRMNLSMSECANGSRKAPPQQPADTGSCRPKCVSTFEKEPMCRAPVCLPGRSCAGRPCACAPLCLPACPPAHASPHRAADGAHPDIVTARGKVATIREISNIAFVIFGPRRS